MILAPPPQFQHSGNSTHLYSRYFLSFAVLGCQSQTIRVLLALSMHLSNIINHPWLGAWRTTSSWSPETESFHKKVLALQRQDIKAIWEDIIFNAFTNAPSFLLPVFVMPQLIFLDWPLAYTKFLDKMPFLCLIVLYWPVLCYISEVKIPNKLRGMKISHMIMLKFQQAQKRNMNKPSSSRDWKLSSMVVSNPWPCAPHQFGKRCSWLGFPGSFNAQGLYRF